MRPILLLALALAGALAGWFASRDAAPVAAERDDPVPGQRGLIIGYDSIQAMNLCGEFVPLEVQSYYFIEILDDAPDADYVAEIRGLMRQTHAERDRLGIIARDALRMRKLVLASLADAAPGSLADAIIIIVARPQDEAVLRPAIEASGARLHFGIYVPADAPVL